MSAKGLSGKTSFIPEYITIHRFSTKFKIRSCFLMNINRDYVSLETKQASKSLPTSFSRSYSTFPLRSGTTLIELAVYTGCSKKSTLY